MDARQLLIRLMRWTLAWASTPAWACQGMPTLRQAFRPRLREPSAKSPEPEIRLADGVRQQPVLQPEQQVAQRVAGMAVAGCSKSRLRPSAALLLPAHHRLPVPFRLRLRHDGSGGGVMEPHRIGRWSGHASP